MYPRRPQTAQTTFRVPPSWGKDRGANPEEAKLFEAINQQRRKYDASGKLKLSKDEVDFLYHYAQFHHRKGIERQLQMEPPKDDPVENPQPSQRSPDRSTRRLRDYHSKIVDELKQREEKANRTNRSVSRSPRRQDSKKPQSEPLRAATAKKSVKLPSSLPSVKPPVERRYHFKDVAL